MLYAIGTSDRDKRKAVGIDHLMANSLRGGATAYVASRVGWKETRELQRRGMSEERQERKRSSESTGARRALDHVTTAKHATVPIRSGDES
jgi:hypothetical protein